MKKLLFVCTGNSHRSILAESVVNKYHKDKFIGYSAGSKPSGIINKYVIKYLNENNFDTKNLSSKNFNKFLNEKTTFDQVFTCLLYTSPRPRDGLLSRMPSSA